MLTSIVLGFFAGRISEPAADLDSVAVSFEQPEVFAIAFEFFLWSLVVLTAAALIWILAPGVIALVCVCSPTVAAYLSFAPAVDCSSAGRDWYFVKRALVGYAGLVVAFCVIALAWHLARRRIAAQPRKFRRWTVVPDDPEGK
jgi:hypothetical protein